MGKQCKSAMKSAVILHEVLKKQGIKHAIVEHRTSEDITEIDCYVLFGFNSHEEKKYNLMQIDAYGSNRDGLVLYRAKRYMSRRANCIEKIMIVLSDGLPSSHLYLQRIQPMQLGKSQNVESL